MNIRTATINDLEEITKMESCCFNQAEAAPKETFLQRLTKFSDHFWLLEDEQSICSCINGLVTNKADLDDEMYSDAALHDENGEWQMLFGVLTFPDMQRKGYASELMRYVIDECRRQGRKGIVLTCKRELVSFYSKFGFMDEGISESVHGSAQWYQMRLRL